jgi:tetrahydromethanopterin S-methyltransferase subunit G
MKEFLKSFGKDCAIVYGLILGIIAVCALAPVSLYVIIGVELFFCGKDGYSLVKGVQ